MSRYRIRTNVALGGNILANPLNWTCASQPDKDAAVALYNAAMKELKFSGVKGREALTVGGARKLVQLAAAHRILAVCDSATGVKKLSAGANRDTFMARRRALLARERTCM